MTTQDGLDSFIQKQALVSAVVCWDRQGTNTHTHTQPNMVCVYCILERKAARLHLHCLFCTTVEGELLCFQSCMNILIHTCTLTHPFMYSAECVFSAFEMWMQTGLKKKKKLFSATENITPKYFKYFTDSTTCLLYTL